MLDAARRVENIIMIFGESHDGRADDPLSFTKIIISGWYARTSVSRRLFCYIGDEKPVYSWL